MQKLCYIQYPKQEQISEVLMVGEGGVEGAAPSPKVFQEMLGTSTGI